MIDNLLRFVINIEETSRRNIYHLNNGLVFQITNNGGYDSVMLKIKDKGRLLQIIKRCNRIIDKTAVISKDEFYHNDDLKEIVSFNLFQIGEPAKGLSNAIMDQHNQVPWRLIIGMKDKIGHCYDTMDVDILWETSTKSIVELKENCILIININGD